MSLPGNVDNSIEVGSNGSVSTVRDEVEEFCFYVAGNPTPLPRNRFFRGGFHNPARESMSEFARQVRELLPQTENSVLFERNIAVKVNIWFYLKRPASDFKGRRREEGNLKQSSVAMTAAPKGPDIDNLAKFVLDALTGVAYADDRQVVQLSLWKLQDNFQTCTGGTYIEIRSYNSQTDPIA